MYSTTVCPTTCIMFMPCRKIYSTCGPDIEVLEALNYIGFYRWYLPSTVGLHTSEHVGTKGCSDELNVRITEHHRKMYYVVLTSGHRQYIFGVCTCYYWILGVQLTEVF